MVDTEAFVTRVDIIHPRVHYRLLFECIMHGTCFAPKTVYTLQNFLLIFVRHATKQHARYYAGKEFLR